jgi:hypothetical protein
MAHPRASPRLRLAAAVLAFLAVCGGAAAARPEPASPAPPAEHKPTVEKCVARCSAATASCRSARTEPKQADAQAIKAISDAYGCSSSPSSSSSADPTVCADLSLALLDLFAYEKSSYNRDGVKGERVVAWTKDDQGKKAPCVACAGTRDVCHSLAEVCVPFCLNDRRPQSEWQVVGGLEPDLGGRLSELPRVAGSEILFNKPVLLTASSQSNQLGISAAYVAYTSRPAGSRASVHFHTSAVVSCVIAGCNRITLAEPTPSGAAEPASFCARADGTPTCYLMPAFTKLLNENVGPGEVRMLDIFSIKPDESYFHSLERLGADEVRQGAGQEGGVAVTIAPAAPPSPAPAPPAAASAASKASSSPSSGKN